MVWCWLGSNGLFLLWHVKPAVGTRSCGRVCILNVFNWKGWNPPGVGFCQPTLKTSRTHRITGGETEVKLLSFLDSPSTTAAFCDSLRLSLSLRLSSISGALLSLDLSLSPSQVPAFDPPLLLRRSSCLASLTSFVWEARLPSRRTSDSIAKGEDRLLTGAVEIRFPLQNRIYW